MHVWVTRKDIGNFLFLILVLTRGGGGGGGGGWRLRRPENNVHWHAPSIIFSRKNREWGCAFSGYMCLFGGIWYRWTWIRIWRTQWDQENWSVICKIRRIHMTNTWYASDWDQAYRPSYAKICRTVICYIQVHLYCYSPTWISVVPQCVAYWLSCLEVRIVCLLYVIWFPVCSFVRFYQYTYMIRMTKLCVIWTHTKGSCS